ncbi:MAG: RNA methyltransferase [Clostridiaceae bacterium]|nr:RNA methyltransferase [Clostridiaceae bacterium]
MNKITSRENSVVKAVVKLIKSREERQHCGLFVCEGSVMLNEAIACGAYIDKVFVTSGIKLPSLPKQAEIFEITEAVLEKISDVKSPQGIVFTCRMPDNSLISGERIIALENVSDPGNVGTIIRTADAFDIDCVVFIGSCADIYSPKTVRSSMGSVFRVKTCVMGLDEFFDAASRLKLPVYAAALTEKAVGIKDAELSVAAVMIGNEASGLSSEALDKCDKHVIIPISGIQSLNAAIAASIFMFEMSAHK